MADEILAVWQTSGLSTHLPTTANAPEVTLSTGQRTFRYAGEDDMICDATTAPDRTES
ncbi:hypothetical protein AB0P23_17260 [Rhodococcus sp. NPDC077669]|uniref:hypothetical protein n=1 Tax=Rhodococcus sp. NPDC077669 TaxID=3155174 RepID=UPI0034132E43